jgi:hypothetical protein
MNTVPLPMERPEAPLFCDGLGDRVVVADGATGELLQILRVRPALTAVPSFEFALRERSARLANFRHAYYARVRRIDRVQAPGPGLAIVSDHVEGTRLSDLLRVASERQLQLDINTALCLIRQLVPAVALLHENARDVAHGLIAPERLIVTPHARLVIVEHVLGAAVEQLLFTRDRLWQEFRIALPSTAGMPRFDHRADVTGMGLVALALVLGRPLDAAEYPHQIPSLLNTARERTGLGEEQPLSAPLRDWLGRALQLDQRRAFASAPEALAALEDVVEDESTYVAAPVALETFLSRYAEALLEPVAPAAPTAVASAPAPPLAAPTVPPLAVGPLPLAAPAAVTPLAPAPQPVQILGPAVAALPVLPAPAVPPVAVPPAALATPPTSAAPPAALFEPVRPAAIPSVSVPEVPLAPASSPPREPHVDDAPAGAMHGSAAPLPLVHDITDLIAADDLRPAPLPAVEDEGPAPAVEPLPRGKARPGGRKRLAAVATVVLALAGGGYFAMRRPATTAGSASLGTLDVQSSPAGVAVFIDGEARGQTPAKLSLTPGAHILELRGRGVPKVIPVNITAGGQVSQYLEFANTPVSGQLQVQSRPAGARVVVDGVDRGAAPVTVSNLTPGDHEVVLQAGTASVRQVVNVQAGGTASIVAPVEDAEGPVSGWVTIKAPVTVQVREGGRLIGTSDADRLMMAAGRHELEISNELLGYTVTRVVQVPAGKVAELAVTLPSGTVNLNASPWAEVWIDGQRVGETPIGNLSIPIGPHEVMFRNPQLGEKRHAISVSLAAPVRLSVDMK